MPQTSRHQPTLIVGREHEEAILSGHLVDLLAGHSSLVLLSGEAGIGKTTLVRALSDAAADEGCLVLTGTCYDVSTAPPYGPWRELVSARTHHADLPSAPVPQWNDEWIARAPNSDAFVMELRAFLEALQESGPILLVLEDLHWADPESLQFLRLFARQVGSMQLLLVATFRDDDLVLNQALYQLLPHLVRESQAQRISLPRLDEPAIQTLVRRRYGLHDPDRDRLTSYLGERSQGIPFYLLELLRMLEEERLLLRTPDGWTLGDIDLHQVPLLVRQVIDGRLARLGPDIRRQLEFAAVIGQEVPLLLWQRVSGVNDDAFGAVVERALEEHVFAEVPAGMKLQFTHALVRDSLYEGMPLPRRQRWHLKVAEALAEDAGSEPDIVADHFQKALDPRAVEWFIRAGSQVERVAWLTAARHFKAALEMMDEGGVDPGERGWLLLRRAKLLRTSQPRTSLAILDTVEALALDARDRLLLVYVRFFRGQSRSQIGQMRAGMADLEASVDALAGLTADDLQRVEELERLGVVLSRAEVDGLLAAELAMAGRIDEALERTESILEHAEGTPLRAWWARAIALALAGRPLEAHQAFITCREPLLSASDNTTIALILLYQLSFVQLPYRADDLAERQRIASEAEAAWQRSGGALGDLSPRLASVLLLQLEGDWRAASELARSGIPSSSDKTSEQHLQSIVVLAQLARAQGDTSLAWELVHEMLPAGPLTVPGYFDLAPSLALVRVAAAMCLDDEDLRTAQAWLELHDRWLAWSGAVLGQADGQLLRAQYYQVAGDLPQAHHHAARALALAGDPRQPLALLAAHRLFGEVEMRGGRFTAAREHLEAALRLADVCAAPYERALTLLAVADLDLRTGALEETGTTLHEARTIFGSLNAAPALARADARTAVLNNRKAAVERTASFGLSPREIEVLLLIARGRQNQEIAETLFVSVRTVERHITNLYAKLGVDGRSEAIAFAHANALI